MDTDFLKPNIFDYAIRELSQDAMICWFLACLHSKNETYKKSLLILLGLSCRMILLRKQILNNEELLKARIENAECIRKICREIFKELEFYNITPVDFGKEKINNENYLFKFFITDDLQQKNFVNI